MPILEQGKYDQQYNMSNFSSLHIRLLKWEKWIQAHWFNTAAFGLNRKT